MISRLAGSIHATSRPSMKDRVIMAAHDIDVLL